MNATAAAAFFAAAPETLGATISAVRTAGLGLSRTS